MRAVESIAVLAGRDADLAHERAAQGLGRAESRLLAHHLERLVGLLEQASRGLDTNRRNELGRRGAHLPREHPREVAWAHAYPAREPPDREILVRMIGDPGLQLAQRLVAGELHPGRGRGLR